ncbi:MAG: hypothetical protein ACREQM_13895 [Candidatus Dormibacteraceae bacterium]
MTGENGRYGPDTEAVERLLSDARVLGPSGIERIAWGWTRYAQGGIRECRSAEGVAHRLVEETGREDAWGAAEADLKELIEGHFAQSAWRSEPASIDRTAEHAAIDATLALVVRDKLPEHDFHTLVKVMSESLPWLLPNEAPDRYRDDG